MSSEKAEPVESSEISAAIRRWTDELRALAQTGLFYVTSEYDRERYGRVERIAAEMAATFTETAPDVILDRWSAETGYVTPKIGLVAAIFDEAGRILMLQRPDSRHWSLPAGFAEIGETPAAGIAREVSEETGLIVEPRRLLGLYDSWRHGSENPHHIYAAGFVCERIGGELRLTAEALDLGYYASDALPEPITRSHRRLIDDAFASWREGPRDAWFDPR